MKKILFAAVMLAVSLSVSAQSVNPSGTVVYSLPSTSVMVKVEAETEYFTAGPLAQYAQKYFGIEARTESVTTSRIKSITLVPYVEADREARYIATVSDRNSGTFLKFCSQGLVVMTDSYAGKSEMWRFPSVAANDRLSSIVTEDNLMNASTTLYRRVKTDDGFKNVAVQQNQVVEKSADVKASEIAQTIFRLRKSREQIITGDTDASFTGEAMGAVINEITRLEQEYLSLFYGVSEYAVQTMNSDVVPSASNPKQMYVAFRVSDTQGLVPAGDMSGRPVFVEFVREGKQPEEGTQSGKGIYYRVPANCTVKVMDGQNVLLQTRMPVYQLGEIYSFPL